MYVIKVGGGEGNAIEPLVKELADRWQSGERWVLVHGGSARVNEVATALDHPPEFVTSSSGFRSRRTDKRTAEIFAMVVTGDVNTSIVRMLQEYDVNAVGLSGLDGRLMSGPRKKAIRVKENGRQRIIRDDYTGKVTSVNADLLRTLLENGYAPVVSPPAISTEEEIINVDGDRAAAAIAGSLKADELILLTGAPGLLADADDPDSRIDFVPRSGIKEAISNYAEGRMRIKLLAASEALDGGVGRVFIGASNTSNPLATVFSGEGTRFEQDAVNEENQEGVEQ
ncbi:MAG: [LysW]-aminoadipate kinase [Candidatus Marinimicrobia bacterium]|nr:[LysW]-aminoadipate kinase [Candidatus Neomarinimicrobiota bacterium]MCF7830017.1 [LysW]-aminoadipate kinase [Candidatus Neomarinimicrobiota bacterium]MCF7881941.1 [LysW]-aminoadipate kinase [Candidatus Neomarinimicrobiota bacterium]